jgi:hypothetical protein
MKRFIAYFLSTIVFLSLSAQTMYICKGTSYTMITGSTAGNMTYSENGNKITVNGTTYSVNDVDSIVFSEPKFDTSLKSSHDTVCIEYQGSSVCVSKNNDSISVTTDGAHVTVISSVKATEITYLLSGTSSDGSLTINGDYKLTVALNGLALTNSIGAAIDVECGKRIAVLLEDGTTNTLIDGSGGSQKACFYVKGHAEISGAGTLELTGNTKHAFSSKEYLEIKNSTGSIIVNSAVSDGLHCGEYFEMNGGTVSVTNTKGDCIDADDLGNVFIKGGTLNLTVSTEDTKGINCDSTFTQSGGDINLTVPTASSQGIKFGMPSSITGGTITGNISGTAAKGIKASGILTYDGGNVTMTVNGATVVEDGDPSYCTGLKTDTTMNMRSGTYKAICTTTGTRGLSVDGILYHTGGTINVTNSGGYASYTNASNVSDTYNSACVSVEKIDAEDGAVMTLAATGQEGRCIKIDNASTINGGTFNLTVGSSTASSTTIMAAKGIKAGSDLTIAGGTFIAYMYGAPIVTNYDPSYSTGVKCDANLNVTGGTYTMNCYGVASRGFSVDGAGIFNGGIYTITTTGAAGSYTASSGTDTYSCKCITSDGALSILGGTYTLKSTGTAGKCITTDGALTIGNSVGVGLSSMTSNPYISCTTTGSSYSSSTTSAAGPGGGGWNPGGGGGGGQTTTGGSSSKTIKAQGDIVINDGYIAVNTSTDGAEGIESKTSITVNNGQIIANCYDDCVNSSGIIKFNGGFTYCKGTGNDAIDSNYGKAGAITITGGVVLGLSFTGSPEEGIDCDADYVVLSGGYVFSCGGTQNGSYPSGISSATQPAAMLSSLSLTNGSYYTLECNGTNLWTIKMPAGFSSSYSMVSAPGMLTGKSCHFYSGTTAPTSATSSYNNCFWIAPTVTTSTTMKTWSQSSTYVKI